MNFATWFGKVIALVIAVLIDAGLVWASLNWFHIGEFWAMVVLVSLNANIIIARLPSVKP